MPLPLLAAGLIANTVGGIIGNIFASGDKAEAQKQSKEAYQMLMDLGVPLEQARPLLVEEMKRQGVYTPEMEEAITLPESEVAQIQEDAKTRDLQGKALELISQRADGGLTSQDRLAFNKSRQQAEQSANAKTQQIVQNAAMRGQSGGGAELAAALIAGQEGANRISSEGDEISAAAAQNALSSIAQLGNQAGALRSQDFNVAQTKADASDRRNQINTANDVSRQTRNVGSRNTAQQNNLSEAQRIADNNTAIRNQELQRQRAGELTDWNARTALAQLKASGKQNYANTLSGQAAQTAGQFAGVGSAVGAGLGNIANYEQKQDYLNRISPSTAKATDEGTNLADLYDRYKKSQNLS